MAGDWIKMRTDLADDPSVIGICNYTGLDEYSVVGRLHKIWSWADRQSIDGHAFSVTDVWIDKYIGHAGFAEAMQLHGWLEITNAGLIFPKFDRHMGESAKKRALATERKRKERSRSERDESVTREEKRREENLTPPSPPSRGGVADKSEKQKVKTPWWEDEDATREKAASVGLSTRPGETWADFRARIRAAIQSLKAAA